MLEPHLLNVGISNRFAAKDVCGHHSRLHQSDATCETSPICAGMGGKQGDNIWWQQHQQQFPRGCKVKFRVQKWHGVGRGRRFGETIAGEFPELPHGIVLDFDPRK